MDPDPGLAESLIETFPPDGNVVRIHLRPGVRQRLNNQLLLPAFIRTT